MYSSLVSIKKISNMAEFIFNGQNGKMIVENGYLFEKQHKRSGPQV